ncbi:MAG TPA: TIGR03790 family protein [Rhodocyclaceae bacterium]
MAGGRLQVAAVRRRGVAIAFVVVLGLLNAQARAQFVGPPRPPASAISPEEVAVVVNVDAPLSVELGERYRELRRIPERNLIRVHLPGSPRRLSEAAFDQLRREIDRQADPSVEVLVLAWTAPYAVECNSITGALALGFQRELCKNTCSPSRPNPYFAAAPAVRPADAGIRLAMLLPTQSEAAGLALMQRGAASDGSRPQASAYLLKTSDANRSSRARLFPRSTFVWRQKLAVKNLVADAIEGERDVMFYFTGLVSVPKLETLGFLPGAVADHLTSAGGDLLGTGQMSSLRWLEAGATASYGTVSEPCNYWEKFPNPAVLMPHYLAGETVVEAYWKSVKWPGQGVFIGEPLASPYR